MTDPKPTTPEEFGDISKADFHKHLEDTAKKVSDMPSWKQGVITGRKPMPNTSEQIALELGWEYFPKHNQWYKWCPPGKIDNLRSYQSNAPDFEHKWAHAGPLLEELFQKCRTFKEFIGVMTDLFWCMADNECGLTEAISHAWLAWKKEEKE